MATSWKKQYGIDWERRVKTVSCPACGSFYTVARGVRSNVEGSMRQRFYKCNACSNMWNTVELDSERYTDLIDTEREIERAMKILKAHDRFEDLVRGVR